jgi:hypothetical protein
MGDFQPPPPPIYTIFHPRVIWLFPPFSHTENPPFDREKRERRGAFYKTAEFSLTNSRQQTLLSSCAWRARSGARCVLWPTHRDTKVQCQYFYRLHSERLCTVSVDRDYYTLLIRQFNFGFLLCVIHFGETILVVNIRWRRKNWLCLTFDTFGLLAVVFEHVVFFSIKRATWFKWFAYRSGSQLVDFSDAVESRTLKQRVYSA